MSDQPNQVDTYRLGDMMVIEMPPAKFLKALAVIAECLHPTFEEHGLASKNGCVITSLAIRHFLFDIGFRDAEIATCMFAIRAVKGDETLHSLGIGAPDHRQATAGPKGWSGHMVVRVPSAGYLIDTTLFQMRRPQWPDFPPMWATPLLPPEIDIGGFGMRAFGGHAFPEPDGSMIEFMWLDQPQNRHWRHAPDFKCKQRWRGVAAVLTEKFGQWEEEPPPRPRL